MQSAGKESSPRRYGLRSRPLSSSHWILAVAILLGITACALITPYDPTSYRHATDLKAESLLLIEKGADAPAAHAAEIQALRLKMRQAYEYERGKGTPNVTTVKQWELLNDPDGALLGGFLKKWQADNKGQSEAFLNGISRNVGAAFDQIIKLENSKVKD
jgi:hypothetical protein